MTRAKYYINSSDGLSLSFVTKEEKEEHRQAKELLTVQTYAKLRAKYGVWDPEQDKYVPEDSNYLQWDDEPPFMEKLYQEYKCKGLV